MAARLVSSNNETRYASAASCRAMTADDWKRKSVCPSDVYSATVANGLIKVQTDLEVLCNFSDETLEGEFANEELGRFLVPSDFTEGDGSGAEAMWFLHTTSCGLWHVRVRTMEGWSQSKVVNLQLFCGQLRTWRRVVYEGLCLQIVEGSFFVQVIIDNVELTSGRLAGGLFGAGHFVLSKKMVVFGDLDG